MVIRTEIKAGKEKFSEVLWIQKVSENGTASGVTSRKVPPDGSSRGKRSLRRSWRDLCVMTKEVKESGESADDNSVDGHLGESAASMRARIWLTSRRLAVFRRCRLTTMSGWFQSTTTSSFFWAVVDFSLLVGKR
jgi:hypothetical protein